MSCDTQYFWNSDGHLTCDEPTLPRPGHSRDWTVLTWNWHPLEFNASQPTSQATFGLEDYWSLEFRELQRAYSRARLALSDQAQRSVEVQAKRFKADKATLPPQLPPNVPITSYHSELPPSESIPPKWVCPATSLHSGSDKVDQDGEQAELPATRLPLARSESSTDARGLLREESGETTSSNDLTEHIQDCVPLYDQRGCDAAAVVSRLRMMDSEFRAEAMRRIKQVEASELR
ncbi:hypothetical protein EKO27_g11339 [Xylaria grammica]|uniref:Uncharacterized protein n=1 Tax=Xylaria grammica TaxID=363999 RepID=A0A439CNM2_9PEZI|nr:hypothetical protein EKO27_g11339 [Xylaria grammica]